MKRPIFALLPLLLLLIPLSINAQVSSSTARSIRSGANLPATCNPGPSVTNVFIKTGAGAGVYYCSATNTWTAVGAGAGSFTTLTTSGASVLASPVTIGVGQTTSATTDLLINPTTKASGNLFQASVNSVNKFSVDFAGAVTYGSLTGGAINSTSTVEAGASNAIRFAGRSSFTSASDGVLLLSNNGITDFTRLQLGCTASTCPALARSTTFVKAQLGDGTEGGGFLATTYNTVTNCSDSAGAAACGSATAGSVVLDASATTVVVSTTSVTANSQIFIQEDSSLGTRLSVTCNTTTGRDWTVSARTAATSFTITSSAAPATNPACLSFHIVN